MMRVPFGQSDEDKIDELLETVADGVNREHRIRRQAKRCGYYVMLPRGAETKRREKAGVGPYVLLHQATNSVVLGAATLDEIGSFLKARFQSN